MEGTFWLYSPRPTLNKQPRDSARKLPPLARRLSFAKPKHAAKKIQKKPLASNSRFLKSVCMFLNLRRTLLILCCTTVLLSAIPAARATTEPSKVPPHRGMTEAQVRKIYGAPDRQQANPRGETWFYFFNAGHYWIPFYMGRPRTGTFHFNDAGVLTDFQYSRDN